MDIYNNELVLFFINGKYKLNGNIPQIIAKPDYTGSWGVDKQCLYYPADVFDRVDYIVNLAMDSGSFNKYKYVLVVNGQTNITETKIFELFIALKRKKLDMAVPAKNNEKINTNSIYADLQCFLIRVDVLKDLEGFDRKFCHRVDPEIYLDPFYVKIPYVDMDLCLRMQKKNYQFAIINSVKINFIVENTFSDNTLQQKNAGEDLIWYRHHLNVSDIKAYNAQGIDYKTLIKEKTVQYEEPLLESGYETGDNRPLILWHYSALLQNFKKGGEIKCHVNILHEIFEALYRKGYQIQFVREDLLNKACAIVFMDCPGDLFSAAYRVYEFPYHEKWIDLIKKTYNTHKLILCTTNEPPMTTPSFYDKEKHKDFRFCLTSNKNLLDAAKYFYQPTFVSFPFKVFKEAQFSDKKLCTFVCGGFFRAVKDEKCLYKKRLELVTYFDKNHPEEFDFWGRGWENKGFQCYRGVAENRFDVFYKYKFIICIPNTAVSSEVFFDPRIFDAMVVGSIPIYLGCPDIKNIIPEDIFVDLRDFPTNDDLYNFINSMDRKTYNGYIKRIKKFLATQKAQRYSLENHIDCLQHVIQKINTSKVDE